MLPALGWERNLSRRAFFYAQNIVVCASLGRLNEVKYLIFHGQQEGKEDAMTAAAEKGHMEIVYFLIENGVDIHHGVDRALRCAAAQGNLLAVQYLLRKGATVRAMDDYALRHAAMNGHTSVVDCLLQAGASMRSRNHCPARQASARGHLDTVMLLHKRGADIFNSNSLYLAAYYGHIDVVKYLVESYVEDDAALHAAIQNHHEEVVTYLRGF